jgi:hypothetical protein
MYNCPNQPCCPFPSVTLEESLKSSANSAVKGRPGTVSSFYMKKTQKISWAWRILYIWYRIMLIYMNFKFNFLSKYHSCIFNCWRIRMFSSRRFTSYITHSRPCCIRHIQPLAFGSSLYIWYTNSLMMLYLLLPILLFVSQHTRIQTGSIL